jgi:hypothetical protein
MKKSFFMLALFLGVAVQATSADYVLEINQGYCPENYSKIQTNCGPQCWTTVAYTSVPGGFGIFTNREPTDSEALLYQSFANAQCAQDNSLEPRP